MRVTKRLTGAVMTTVLVTAGLLIALPAIPAYAATPTITQLLPPAPKPGCVASLTGANYQTVANGGPVSLVNWTQGGTTPNAPVSIDSDTQLEATVPAGFTASTPASVTVTNTTGTSAAWNFSTGPAAPDCPGTPTPSPTSGAVGATVVITGTFNAVPFFVRFNTVSATIVGSPTASQVTVTVPAGATTGPVRVYTTAGVASSLVPFTVTGTAAPTITSFTPTSGPVGTSVTITGTNFTGATSVTFNNVNAPGFTVNGTGTQITVAVPTGATTGSIRVITPGGTATSATTFTVTGGAGHPRNVSLKLTDTRAKGSVTATDGFAACENWVPVRIQKQKSGGGWQGVELLATNGSGDYSGLIPKGHGKYRAKAVKITLDSGAVCGGDTSPIRST